MKGEMKMKRFLCVLLVCLMVVPSAFALDLEDFNMYAYIFGEEELDASKAISASGLIMIDRTSCRVTFSEDDNGIKRIIVDGDGIPLLAYSMAAIMTFDSDSSHFSANAGQLLSAFLMSRNGETQQGQIANRNFFLIEKKEDNKGFFFTIGR